MQNTMYLISLLFLLAVFCTGCGQYGYHPNYIISEDETPPSNPSTKQKREEVKERILR